MATSVDFTEYVCEQIADTGIVTYKKMFGEYMVYVNAKPILLVCDNTVYVKMLDEVKNIMQNTKMGSPYKGAKPHYILDIENKELCKEIIGILEPITMIPKPRKKKIL